MNRSFGLNWIGVNFYKLKIYHPLHFFLLKATNIILIILNKSFPHKKVY